MQVEFTSRQLVSTDSTKTKLNTVSIDTKPRLFDNDALYELLPDLVNDQYRAWYCKRFYVLGKDKVLKLASVARADAKADPRKYFSVLLKRAS